MAEYIEREAAYEKCGWYNTVNGKSVCAIRKDELTAIPTIDAVPVVRCKDCKHWTVDGLGHPWCDMWEDYQYHEEVFCYYGERKDGE